MIEFKKYKLGEIADVIVSTVDKKSKAGQKVVRLCNFVDVYKNWAITHDLYDGFMVATASDVEIERFTIKKGQVAFTKDSETRDDIGIATYIADDFEDVVLGYHTALITPHEDIILGKYLNAFLHSKYILKYFELNATGSGMRYTLSQDTINNIPVLVPSLEEQNRIGNFFSSIDKKICCNQKAASELETAAKQIYDYWFVQFDFPNENGKPYKTSGGKMVWNEILKREIPEGWLVATLDQLGSFRNGINYSINEVGDKEYRIVNVRNITSSTILLNVHELDHITLNTSNAEKYIISNTDILLARSGTPGATRVLPSEATNVIFCGFIICFTLKQLEYKPYLTYRLKELENITNGQSNGSILNNISQDVLKRQYSIIPPLDVINKWNSIIQPIWDYLSTIMNDNNCTLVLKNEILPLLMNGQAKIS